MATRDLLRGMRMPSAPETVEAEPTRQAGESDADYEARLAEWRRRREVDEFAPAVDSAPIIGTN